MCGCNKITIVFCGYHGDEFASSGQAAAPSQSPPSQAPPAQAPSQPAAAGPPSGNH